MNKYILRMWSLLLLLLFVFHTKAALCKDSDLTNNTVVGGVLGNAGIKSDLIPITIKDSDLTNNTTVVGGVVHGNCGIIMGYHDCEKLEREHNLLKEKINLLEKRIIFLEKKCKKNQKNMEEIENVDKLNLELKHREHSIDKSSKDCSFLEERNSLLKRKIELLEAKNLLLEENCKNE
jgi:hypothetical protein